MSLITNLSIRTKLLAGFGAVIVLLAVLGLSSTGQINGMADETANINNNTLPSISLIDDIALGVQTVRKDQFKLGTVAPGEQAEVIGDVEKGTADVTQMLTSYEKLVSNAQDRAVWERATTEFEAFSSTTAGIVAAVQSGDVSRSRRAYAASKGRSTKLQDTLSGWADLNDKLGDASYADAQATASSARKTTLAIVLFAVLVASAIAFVLSRYLSAGIGQLLRAARGIAQGDVKQDVTLSSKDELGQLGTAFGEMTGYLQEMATAAETVAAGDLTADVHPRGKDDALGNAVVAMTDNLRDLVGSVQRNATVLSTSSQEMASTSEEAGRAVNEIASAVSDVAQGAERQVRSVEGARLATEEVSAATQASAQSAQETAVAAAETRRVAEEGAAAVTQATEAMRAVQESSAQVTATMRQLGAKSEQIGGIVETITGISEQTNLLALNAAIEAARAGEQGRGFAVVAEEVRKLAEESQAAAATIATLVTEIQGETTQAVAVVEETAERTVEGAATVEQARDAFGRIGVSVEDMTGRVDQIAAAVQQIAAGAQKVQADMVEVAAVAEESSASSEQVSASTQETSASAQEIASSAQQLAATANELEQLVGRFTLAAA
ncbi:MAG TPA: methyl-accepting chemotaxis protein [Solirubrobacteraceae bacterium]|nr:methyl-accepting chemotaxis protein [Solirubrobacteraceae bacterium]